MKHEKKYTHIFEVYPGVEIERMECTLRYARKTAITLCKQRHLIIRVLRLKSNGYKHYLGAAIPTAIFQSRDDSNWVYMPDLETGYIKRIK